MVPKSPVKRKHSIHLIGNAHLDPTWLWTWQEGFSEIRATFRAALDRIAQFKDFIFTCSSASYYEWIEEIDPEMFQEIQICVKEGRWVIVGGWWLQADCNIPSGESFVRHALYSQRYFKEKFGVTAKVGYSVDSFGHNGMLPQILKKSGMDYYVFMRPGKDENRQVPQSLFLWKSSDGSEIIAYRIPFSHYNSGNKNNMSYLRDTQTLSCSEDLPLMHFYGVGNHGGGPTVKMVDEFINEDDPQLHFSSPDKYFASIQDKKDSLPTWQGDLQHHAPGCYSAYRAIKQSNYHTENILYEAEVYLSLVAQYVSQEIINNKNAELAVAWKQLLFNQFHDILGGCSIAKGLNDGVSSNNYSSTIAERVKNYALQVLSKNIDTSWSSHDDRTDFRAWNAEEGCPVVVFNPLPRSISSYVILPFGNVKKVEYATETQQRNIKIQTIRADYTNITSDRWKQLAYVEIPAMGYQTLKVFLNDEDNIKNYSPLNIFDDKIYESYTIQNKYYSLKFSDKGDLTSIYSKQFNMEIVTPKESFQFRVYSEYYSDTWAHGILSFNDHFLGKFQVTNKPVLFENGALRKTILLKYKFNISEIKLYLTLYYEKPYIELRTEINWQEKHCLLKAELPHPFSGGTARYGMPFGWIDKQTNGEEEPLQRWHGCYDSSSNMGIFLINGGEYSGAVTPGKLQLTMVRSPQFADHFALESERSEHIPCMDLGKHSFKWYLSVINIDNIDIIEEIAVEQRYQATVVSESFHKGILGYSSEFLKIDNKNIFISTLKVAENNDNNLEFIIRLYNIYTKEQCTNIKFMGLTRGFFIKIAPFEFKSYLLNLENNTAKEVNLLEW